MDFLWRNKPEHASVKDNQIIMTAGSGTNLFNSPSGYFSCDSFPYYYTECSEDFVVRCRLTPAFRHMYDLGCIVIWDDSDKWIKFACENTDNGYPAIVSIVTDKFSDDCNGAPVEGSIWLQISRKENVFALHYSTDKCHWCLARICRLPMSQTVQVGISAQCPSGEHCQVLFEDLEILPNTYTNLRKAE